MKPEEFRKVCGRFSTGVAILTVSDASGHPHGVTVNSFTSVSADPPLVLVCLDKSSALLPHFEASPHYGLSFLAEDQRDLSERFAFVPERRFDGVNWHHSERQIPVITGSIASLECRVAQRIAAGDHIILMGEVIAAEVHTDARPLIYYGSGYRRLAP